MLLRSIWPESQGKFPWLSSDVFPDRKPRARRLCGWAAERKLHSFSLWRVHLTFISALRRAGTEPDTRTTATPQYSAVKKARGKHAPCLLCFIQSTALRSTTSLLSPDPAVVLTAISAFCHCFHFPSGDQVLAWAASALWLDSLPHHWNLHFEWHGCVSKSYFNQS